MEEGPYPPTGISVLIVGGGVGGMMTALECKRKGHNVHVLEKHPQFTNIGDVFSVLPPALVTIHHYPELRKGWENLTAGAATIATYKSSGELLVPNALPEWNRPGRSKDHQAKVHVPWTENRAEFVKLLIDEVERQKIPVTWGQDVVDYAEHAAAGTASVRTAAGFRYEADIVVAADGIGTKSHAAVTGAPVNAKHSGYAIYRFGIPTDVALADETVRAGLGWSPATDEPEFRLYFGQDMHMNLILSRTHIYPLLTHPAATDPGESWHAASLGPSAVLATLDKHPAPWAPHIAALIRATPASTPVVHWALTWRDPQPQWTSPAGRIVQLGDAAHAFLPTSGNGATQALEDGISLAEALRVAGGKEKAGLATAAHALLRFQRVSVIQRTGIANRRLWHNFDLDAALRDPAALARSVRFGAWIWSHDPEKYAAARAGEAMRAVERGEVDGWANTNLPKGMVYEPWTMESELEAERRGVGKDLKEDGDWSI